MKTWRFLYIFLAIFIIGILFIVSNKTSFAIEKQDAGGGAGGGTEWYNPPVKKVSQDIFLNNEQANFSKYIFSQLNTSAVSIAFMALGPLDSNQQTSQPTGAVPFFGKAIASMVSRPPININTYIADIGYRMGFSKPVYAQSFGMKALSPILPLWKAFRNIAYFGFVIIFVLIGLMIMLQSKSGQSMLNVQMALPQIIITLILITFSYAIASLTVDFIYVIIYLTINLFSSFNIISNVSVAEKAILDSNIFSLIFGHFITIGGDAGTVNVAASAVNQAVTDLFNNIGGSIAGMLSGALSFAIFAIVILMSTWKLFWKLLMAFLGIILMTIFSPIILIANAFPGSKAFGGWVKGIIAQALIFPAVAILILVSAALVTNANFGIDPNIGYQAGGVDSKVVLPFIGGGGVSTNAIMALLSIGMISIMPAILDIIQKTLGVEGGAAGLAKAAVEPIAQGYKFTKGATTGLADYAMDSRARKILYTNKDPEKKKGLFGYSWAQRRALKKQWGSIPNNLKPGAS